MSDDSLFQRSCRLVVAACDLQSATAREESVTEVLMCVENVKTTLDRYREELERSLGLSN